jgi:hypothetical protein
MANGHVTDFMGRPCWCGNVHALNACSCDAPWILPPSVALDAFAEMSEQTRRDAGCARVHREWCNA